MAIERTAVSPVGETIKLIPDDRFADLLGSPSRPGALGPLMRWAQPRTGVLRALWHEGRVEDRKSGRATAILLERAQRYGAPPGTQVRTVAQMFTHNPAMAPCVGREMNAKRTYSIALRALPERWFAFLDAETPEPEPDEIVEAPSSHTEAPDNEHGGGPPSPVLNDRPAVELELANAVATALLTQVVEIISTGGDAGPQVSRLQLDIEALEARLSTQVAYADTLRRQVREAGDEIVALRHERDGLRQRLRSAEHNLKVATSADAQRVIDAEVRRQLERIMRQTPNGAQAKAEG